MAKSTTTTNQTSSIRAMISSAKAKSKAPSTFKPSSSARSSSTSRTSSRAGRSSSSNRTPSRNRSSSNRSVSRERHSSASVRSRSSNGRSPSRRKDSSNDFLKSPSTPSSAYKSPSTPSPSAHKRSTNASKTPRKSPSYSKRFKSSDIDIVSPTSTVTTASTLSVASPASMKSSKSNHSRDRKVSKSMKALNMENKGIIEPPSIRNISTNEVDYLNCNWLDPSHLETLAKIQAPQMPDEAHKKLHALGVKDKLTEVIDMYPPSQLKAVYVQVCGILKMKPDADFTRSNSAPKIKDTVDTLIWKNRLFLKDFWNR